MPVITAVLGDLTTQAPARLVEAAEGLIGLGAAVRRELASLEPRWPTVRRIVIVTTAMRQLVAMPSIGGYTVGPADVVDGAGLPEAVRAVRLSPSTRQRRPQRRMSYRTAARHRARLT